MRSEKKWWQKSCGEEGHKFPDANQTSARAELCARCGALATIQEGLNGPSWRLLRCVRCGGPVTKNGRACPDCLKKAERST